LAVAVRQRVVPVGEGERRPGAGAAARVDGRGARRCGGAVEVPDAPPAHGAVPRAVPDEVHDDELRVAGVPAAAPRRGAAQGRRRAGARPRRADRRRGEGGGREVARNEAPAPEGTGGAAGVAGGGGALTRSEPDA